MTLSAIIALLNGPLGASALALVVAWLGGKGIGVLLKYSGTRKMLGVGLKSAGAPAVVFGKWLQAGPLHFLSGPIICVMVFCLFWLYTFMDRLITLLKPDTLEMVKGLEAMLAEIGSTDRRLYLQTKTMTEGQVKAVTQMAEAVAAGPAQLTADQQESVIRVQAIGSLLQQSRLESK